MPNRPQRFSPYPAQRVSGQSSLTQSTRPSACKRGYDRVWRKFAKSFLDDNPTCDEPGCHRRATDVDHDPPLTGPDDPGRLDPKRCRALCKSHHSAKTVRQDGGLGRKKLQLVLIISGLASVASASPVLAATNPLQEGHVMASTHPTAPLVKCLAADCERPAEKRGYCGRHYQRLVKHGAVHARSRTAADGFVPRAKDRPEQVRAVDCKCCGVSFRRPIRRGSHRLRRLLGRSGPMPSVAGHMGA